MCRKEYWLLLFLSLIFVFQRATSQTSLTTTIDSLSLIISSSSDTTKANAYYELGRLYVKSDSFKSALEILELGANYSKSIDFNICTGKIFEFIGITHDIQGDLDASLLAYEEAREYHKKVPNNEESLNLIDINIGVAYYFAGNLGKALEFYLKAYEEAKRINQKDHIAKLVNNIAIIYRRSKKYEEALQYYKESLAIKRSTGDKDGEATTLQNTGFLFSHMDQIDSSLFYLDAAKKLMLEIGASQSDIDYVDYARAEGYYNIDDFEMALSLMKKFEENNFSSLEESIRLNGKIVLADLYAQNDQHRKSIAILNGVENEIGEDDYPRELQQLHEYRAKYNLILGNHKSAAQDFLQSSVLSDSINSKDRQQLESEMQTKYSTLQKEQQIEKLTLEKQFDDLKLSQQRIGLFVVSSGLLLLSFLFYRLFKQKNKIEVQSKVIAKSAEEKDILLREIHHRVKNNLQVVSSLLGIQGRGIKDQKAKNAIQEGRNRVHSMSLIHQNLYKKDNLTGIEMKPYIDKLSQHLLQTYQLESGIINIETEIDDITLDVETVVPIGLILNELMSNSLKYAFPNGQNGTITIHLKEKEAFLILTLADNGIGLDAEQLKTKTDSFGHSLIRAFKKKLDAEIKISGTPGTSVTIEIKNFKKIIL